MTLIIYNKCNDGSVIILDRKETNTSSVGQITKKYYLPRNEEFVLSLAGDSERIDTIVTALTLDKNIDSNSIIRKLDEIIKKAPIFTGDLKESSGLLLVKDKASFTYHNVWFTNSNRSIVEENPKFKCYGEGAPLADYLIRKFDLQNISWQLACQYLIAIMQEVSSSIDSVGSLEKFGFDIIVIANSGEVRSCTLYELDGLDKINCIFNPITAREIECLSEQTKIKEEKIPKIKPIEKMQQFERSGLSKTTNVIQNSYEVSANGRIYDVKYSITNGKLLSIIRDAQTVSLIITIQSDQDGLLEITIPRQLLDATIRKKDDQFFILIDGAEAYYEESTTDTDRTLIIHFRGGSQDIEIIGTELVLYADKRVYTYGDNVILTIVSPNEEDALNLEISDKRGNVVYSKFIPFDEKSGGSYQEIIPLLGKSWSKPNQEYEITIKSGNKTAQVVISTDDFGTSIRLDKKVYSWTDKVRITIIAPDLVRDYSKVESIGNASDQQVFISTSKGSLPFYTLQETGNGTGIFTGSIILTGFMGYEVTDSIHKKNELGITSGVGPDNGLLECTSDDRITVKITTPKKIVSASSQIRWNIGEIMWLQGSYPAIGIGEIRLVDPDLNLYPNSIDKFNIRVWSDTDKNGIKIAMIETGESTGIFKGQVFFTVNESNSPKLRVSEGDTVIAEYKDKTLPPPYTIKDELTIHATTAIGALSLPMERISITSAIITDVYGNELAEVSTGQTVMVTVGLKNISNKQQSFAYILQIQDDKSNDISLSSISGLLSSGQSLTPSLSWIPTKPGEYKVTIFIWESIDNPEALSPSVTLTINAIGEEKPQTLELQIPSSKELKGKQEYPHEPRVVIPKGSSIPGCEKTNECFIPSEIKIHVNKTIIWKNEDYAAHTVTSGTPDRGPDGEFDSSMFGPEKSFAFKFKKKGIYPYYCAVHPWQIGKVEVD